MSEETRVDPTEVGGAIGKRAEMFDHVEKQRQKELDDEMGTELAEEEVSDPAPGEEDPPEDPKGDDPPPVEGDDPPPEEQDPEPEPEPEPTPSPDDPSSDPDMVLIKVDGEEKYVPKSAILDAGVRTFQKEAAADQRLQDASRIKTEAEELLAKAKTTTPTLDQAQVDEAELASIVNDIQYGTAEEGTKALTKLIGMTKGGGDAGVPTTTPPAVTTEDQPLDVDAKIQDALKTQNIRERFARPPDQGGFSDVDADPYLKRIAIHRAGELLDQGKPDEWSTYAEAGQWVRDTYLVKESPKKDPPTGDGTSDPELDAKKKKKEKIDSPPGTGARAPGTTTEPEEAPQEEPNPSGVIADMRKQRGQV